MLPQSSTLFHKIWETCFRTTKHPQIFHISTKCWFVKPLVISDVECVERVEAQNCMFFWKWKMTVHISSALDTCAVLDATACRKNLPCCPWKTSQTYLNLPDVAFNAFSRCKVIAACTHARPRRVAFGNSPALRVVIPGQALLSVRSSRTLQAV